MQVKPINTIDPLTYGEEVLKRVYDPVNNKRLVRRIREGRSYGTCTTIDLVGCDMLCSYCYTDTPNLTGKIPDDSILAREMKKKKGFKAGFYTPKEIANEAKRVITEEGYPKNIQITAAETFLTQRWTLELIDELAQFVRRNDGLIWADTNGTTIVYRNPKIIDALKPYSDVLRIFVSSKNSPELYEATTRADSKYSDTGFQCIEMLWKDEMPSYVQAISALFMPSSFEWYERRLERIHKAAPLLLDLDHLSYLPLNRIRSRLKSTGLWDIRQKDTKIDKEWKAHVEAHYGRSIARLFSVDFFPEDEKLIRELVFEDKPLEECYLFEQESK